MPFFKDMMSSSESCAIWRINTLSSQCFWPLMFDLATFFTAVPSCFLPWDEGILRIQFSYSYPLPKHHLSLFIYGPVKTHTKHTSLVLASGHPLWHHYSHLLFKPAYYFPCYKPYFWCPHFCYYISMLQSPRLKKSDILSFNLTFLCHVSWNHSFLPIPTDNMLAVSAVESVNCTNLERITQRLVSTQWAVSLFLFPDHPAFINLFSSYLACLSD